MNINQGKSESEVGDNMAQGGNLTGFKEHILGQINGVHEREAFGSTFVDSGVER